MSKIKTKYLRRAGIVRKSTKKKARSYAKEFVKANRRFAINDFAFSLGLNDGFIIQSSKRGKDI